MPQVHQPTDTISRSYVCCVCDKTGQLLYPNYRSAGHSWDSTRILSGLPTSAKRTVDPLSFPPTLPAGRRGVPTPEERAGEQREREQSEMADDCLLVTTAAPISVPHYSCSAYRHTHIHTHGQMLTNRRPGPDDGSRVQTTGSRVQTTSNRVQTTGNRVRTTDNRAKTDLQTDERTDEQTDGRTDGQTDGQTG